MPIEWWGPPTPAKPVNPKLRDLVWRHPPKWEDEFHVAKQKAKETKTLILAAFTGHPWCKPCYYLDKEVFQSPEFENWWFGKVQLLNSNWGGEGHTVPALWGVYGIEGTPTVYALNATGGIVAGGFSFSKGSGKAQQWIDEFSAAAGLS